jgi:hypothetical protein
MPRRAPHVRARAAASAPTCTIQELLKHMRPDARDAVLEFRNGGRGDAGGPADLRADRVRHRRTPEFCNPARTRPS